MMAGLYRYTFSDLVDWIDVESSLQLAIVAAEAIHSEVDVRMHAPHVADPHERILTVDATSEVGRCIGRLITQFFRKEFGDAAFQVSRVAPSDLDTETA